MQALYAQIPEGLLLVLVSARQTILTWQDVIEGWANSSDFQRLFDGLLQLVPDSQWATSPLADWGVPFMLFYRPTPPVRETPPSWIRTLTQPDINVVTSPKNSGFLILPGTAYSSWANFVQTAPSTTRTLFYQTLSNLARQYLGSRILAWVTSNYQVRGWLNVEFNEQQDVTIPLVNAQLSRDLTPWLSLGQRYFPNLSWKIGTPVLRRAELATIQILQQPQVAGELIFPEEETPDPLVLAQYRVYITQTLTPDLVTLAERQQAAGYIPRIYLLAQSSVASKAPFIQATRLSARDFFQLANRRTSLAGANYPIYLENDAGWELWSSARSNA